MAALVDRSIKWQFSAARSAVLRRGPCHMCVRCVGLKYVGGFTICARRFEESLWTSSAQGWIEVPGWPEGMRIAERAAKLLP